MRKKVVKFIRECLSIETQVNELDEKIALLIKNRISLEEVFGFSSKQMRSHLAHEQASKLEKDTGVITLKGNDKDSQDKRKKYQELFYLLQTQPKYLSALMFNLNKTGGTSVTKFLEGVVLTLFGQVQSPREEYLFLNLIDSCITVELNDITKIEEFYRDNPLFIKLVLQYIRGAKERKFLRTLLQPLVKMVMADNSLELETDAVSIYRAIIRQEELNTGEKSNRNYDISPPEAASCPEVIEIQLERVGKMKDICGKFLIAICGSLDLMPFGIRYISQTVKEVIGKKFPGANFQQEIYRVVGNLIYYRYMNPAIVAPEAFDIIESTVSPAQRKNLAEIAKILHQIQVSCPFSGSNPAVEELNSFVLQESKRFQSFIKEASTVETIQEHFGMNEFLDMSLQEKPSIYITPEEIIQIHNNLDANLNYLAKDSSDPLKIILAELGSVPSVSSAAKGPGSELTLHLSNRFAKTEKPEDAEKRNLISEAKLLVKCIIRIQKGKSLLKILEDPGTEEMQKLFEEYIDSASKQTFITRLNSFKQLSTPGSIETQSKAMESSTTHLAHLKNEDDTL